MKVKFQFRAGQLWMYRSPIGLESRLLILKTEKIGGEKIIHVTVVGDEVDFPGHMPFSESAIEKSVTELCQEGFPLPDFEDGYSYWKQLYLKDEAGIYTISVCEALGL